MHDVPQPSVAELSILLGTTNKILVAKAKGWFERESHLGPNPVVINWSQAHISDDYVIAPLVDSLNVFANASKKGYRYAVVKKVSSDTYTGRIIEMVVPLPAIQNEQAIKLALSAIRPLLINQPAASIPGFTGYILAYSPTYHYQIGVVYEQGIIQPKRITMQSHRTAKKDINNTIASYSAEATTSSFIDNETVCITITTCGTVDGEFGGCFSYSVCFEAGGGGDGGGWGGDTGGGGGSGPTSTQTVDSKLPPCANNVLNNLLASAVQGSAGNNLLDAILLALQMPNSKMAVHFVTDNTLAANVAGDCKYNNTVSSSSNVNDFTIRLNTAFLDGSATDLFIAQTMLHETLHAALIDWALTNNSPANGVSFDDLLASFMAMQGLSPSDAQGQHDAMSLLVGKLGDALYNYYSLTDHSGSLGASSFQYTSRQDCENLCWTGLENTIGYQWAVAHDPSFKLKCDAIHGAELTGQWAATGSQAAGTLQQRYPAGTDPCP